MQRLALSSYLRLAEKLTADRSEKCRWQATIIVGEFISSHPDQVWPILKRHTADTADDAKEMLGTVLLEHLLPVNFDRYFTEIHDRVTAGDEALRDILCYCWNVGVTDSNWKKVRSLPENSRQTSARKNAGP